MNTIKNNRQKSILPNLFFGLSGLLFAFACLSINKQAGFYVLLLSNFLILR
jgi:hypothetical protein